MRRTLFVSLTALPLVACVGDQQGDVATGEVVQHIVGGEVAKSADYPTVVALEQDRDWFCTGTLIDKEWVLTAAHCVVGMTANIEVRFDSTNLNFANGGKRVAIAGVYSHKSYRGDTWDNDIALIKLAHPVTDREPTPLYRAAMAPTTAVWQLGYGAVSDNGASGELHCLKTNTIDCAMTGDTSVAAENVVCFDQTDGNGTCYGDSGGPSFVKIDGKFQVAAITSGGTLESCLDGFDIQTSVHSELDFLDAVMSGSVPPDAPDDPSMPGDEGGESGGCSTGGTGGFGGLLLVGLALCTRRRR